MKKFYLPGLFILAFTFICPSIATAENGGPLAGYPRALANAGTFFVEWPRIASYEAKERGWFSPVSFIPHMLFVAIVRAASSTQDLIVTPFYYPFTKDSTPLTRRVGLGDYPWQIGSEETDTF